MSRAQAQHLPVLLAPSKSLEPLAASLSGLSSTSSSSLSKTSGCVRRAVQLHAILVDLLVLAPRLVAPLCQPPTVAGWKLVEGFVQSAMWLVGHAM